ncbi:MAG: DUF4179 domain-containing protein [Oscillospiraceae bacterium]|nr:DUF4179 domain-containing protein [Oscillospiraceae bacterium]
MSGIDEIMRNIDIDEDYCSPLGRAERKRILNIINKKTGTEPGKKHHIARILLIAACITVIFAAATALAVNYFYLDSAFGSKVGIADDKYEKIKSAVDTPMCSVTDNGVTVRVLQTLADSRTIYAVFEVIAREDVKLESWYEFERASLKPEDWRQNAEKYGAFELDVSVAEVSGNRMKCIAVAEGFTETLPSCRLSLELENISRRISWEPGHEWNTLIEGKWELSWDYDSEKNPEMKIYPVNIPLCGADGSAAVTEITLSPISALFKIRYPAREERLIDEASVTRKIIGYAAPAVKMKDGSIINWENAHTFESLGYDDDNYVVVQYYIRFNDVTDPDDIAGIVTDGNLTELE